jgi:hypothetical protein
MVKTLRDEWFFVGCSSYYFAEYLGSRNFQPFYTDVPVIATLVGAPNRGSAGNLVRYVNKWYPWVAGYHPWGMQR